MSNQNAELLALLAKQRQAPAQAATKMQVLEAGKYRASKLSFSTRVAVTNADAKVSKNPDTPYASLTLNLLIDDPILAEKDLPVRTLSRDLLSTFLSGDNGLSLVNLQLESGEVIPQGLSLEGNGAFWTVFGNACSVVGLASVEASSAKAELSQEVKDVMYGDEAYVEAMTTYASEEPVKNAKGEEVDRRDLHPLLIMQHQVIGLNKLLTSQLEQANLRFLVTVGKTMVKNNRTGQQEEINTILEVKAVIGESESDYVSLM